MATWVEGGFATRLCTGIFNSSSQMDFPRSVSSKYGILSVSTAIPQLHPYSGLTRSATP